MHEIKQWIMGWVVADLPKPLIQESQGAKSEKRAVPFGYCSVIRCCSLVVVHRKTPSHLQVDLLPYVRLALPTLGEWWVKISKCIKFPPTQDRGPLISLGFAVFLLWMVGRVGFLQRHYEVNKSITHGRFNFASTAS